MAFTTRRSTTLWLLAGFSLFLVGFAGFSELYDRCLVKINHDFKEATLKSFTLKHQTSNKKFEAIVDELLTFMFFTRKATFTVLLLAACFAIIRGMSEPKVGLFEIKEG